MILSKKPAGDKTDPIFKWREKVHSKGLEDASPSDLTPLHTKGKYGFGLDRKKRILEKVKDLLTS